MTGLATDSESEDISNEKENWWRWNKLSQLADHWYEKTENEGLTDKTVVTRVEDRGCWNPGMNDELPTRDELKNR